MAGKMLNIELGKRICKVCVSQKKGKAFEITDSFVFATPADTVLDGQCVDSITLGDELRNELDNRNIDCAEVIFSIASSKVATREVTVPGVKADQIKTIVQTNASDYFPVDTANYKIDSIVLSQENGESRVLVIAIPLVMIESYINLAEQAGLVIDHIDYVGNSHYQVLRGFPSEGVTMYATVEPESSSILFMENGNLLMQRSMQMGGDDFISRYMDNNELDEFSYLKALDALSVQGAELDSIELERSLAALVNGIARSQDFFLGGKFADKEINRVVLMGSCSHLSGLKESIGATLEIETVWLEDLEGIQGLANSINDISVYIGCLGSRLAPLRVLPKEYLDKVGKSGSKNIQELKEKYGYLIAGLGVFLSIVLTATSIITYVVNKKELDKIQSRISEIQYAEERYNTYIQYKQGDENLSNFVNGSIKHNAKLVAFFSEMELKMPSEISVLSASCTEDSVSLNISVPDYKEAAMVLRQFRTFESIDVVNCSSFSKSGEAGLTTVSFSVNCTYKPEEQPVVEEAPAEEAPAEENAEG